MLLRHVGWILGLSFVDGEQMIHMSYQQAGRSKAGRGPGIHWNPNGFLVIRNECMGTYMVYSVIYHKQYVHVIIFLWSSYSSSMSTSQRSVGSQVFYSSVEVDGDFEGHFRACRPIKKGEVLGVSYMNLGNR